MRKVLYLVSKVPGEISKSLLPPGASSGEEVSVILIEDGVSWDQAPGHHVFALAEDVAIRRVSSKIPTLSYRDMLRLIFEADTVISL